MDALAGIMATEKARRYPNAQCSICPLADRPLVPSLLMENAHILVVGEAPANQEVTQQRPFVGESGYILENTLNQVTDYDRVALTNTVLCNGENNEKPPYKAMLACRDRLLEEIQACNPDVVIAAGGSALQSLDKNQRAKITQERGSVRTYRIGDEEYRMVPTFHPAFLHKNPGAWTDFARDMELAVRVADGVPQEGHVLPRVRVSACEDETLAFFDWITQFYWELAADIETASRLNRIRFGEDRIISNAFSWGDGEEAFVVPFEHFHRSDVASRFLAMLADRTWEWIYHNGKFDTKHLSAHFGAEVPITHDTMIQHYVIDERRGTHDLKQRASRDLGAPEYEAPLKEWLRNEKTRRRRHNSVVKKEIRRWEKLQAKATARQQVGAVADTPAPAHSLSDLTAEDLTYDDVPKDMLYLYQGYDVAYTMRLHRKQMERIAGEGLCPIYEFMMRASRALAKMEMHGVLIDVPYRETLKGGLQADMESLLSRMRELAGPDFDPESVKKLAAVLFGDAESGGLGLVPPPRTKRTVHGWSTAKDVLDAMEAQHPIIPLLKSYRGLSKLHGSYVVRLEKFLYADGRIRPDYKQHGTVTGRMSEPIMTWPKPDPKHPEKPHIRNLAIVPPPDDASPEGYAFLEGDAAAGELRIMACLSGEPLWVDAFNAGRDVHGEVMKELGFGDLEQAIRDMGGDEALGEKLYEKRRRDIKIVNFGVAYGMEENLLSRILGWDVWRAKQFLRDYWDRHAVLRSWLEEVKEQALSTGTLRTPFGRVRRYGLITRPVVKAIRNEAGNFLPQSILSDTMLAATTRLVEETWDQGVKPILFVHDAAGIETPVKRAEEVAKRFGEIVADTFASVVWPFGKANVVMETDFKVGRSWGSARKWKVGDPIAV